MVIIGFGGALCQVCITRRERWSFCRRLIYSRWQLLPFPNFSQTSGDTLASSLPIPLSILPSSSLLSLVDTASNLVLGNGIIGRWPYSNSYHFLACCSFISHPLTRKKRYGCDREILMLTRSNTVLARPSCKFSKSLTTSVSIQELGMCEVFDTF